MAATTSANAEDAPDAQPTEFVILGSGVSTALPRISCIIRPRPGGCAVCSDGLANAGSKNRRGNVSALVRAGGRSVLIDVGKTVREVTMRHFPTLGVRDVDAIVLTHGHADAMLGLDDVRDIQRRGTRYTDEKGNVAWTSPEPTPVFLNMETMATCRSMFPYLVPHDLLVDPASRVAKTKDIKRTVASLDWQPYGEDAYFKPFRPVADAPIEFTPLPLLHGGTYVCMGFVIRVGGRTETSTNAGAGAGAGAADDSAETDDDADVKTIVYLSDLHELPDRSRRHIMRLARIDLLVVDMLTHTDHNRSHLSRGQAERLVRELRPVQAVAVGMTCSLGLHDEVNASLARQMADEEDGVPFRLSYDGERFAL